MCFFKDASIWNLDPHSAHLNNDEDEDEDEEEDEEVFLTPAIRIAWLALDSLTISSAGFTSKGFSLLLTVEEEEEAAVGEGEKEG